MSVIRTALLRCARCRRTTTASVHRDGTRTCLTCMHTTTQKDSIR